MVANELAQWAVLAFLAVFVLGLTRQLGKFLVSPRDQLVAENGPAIGKQLSERAVGAGGAASLAQLMQARHTSWAAMLVVGEGCVGCEPLLERLETDGVPDSVPLLIAARAASVAYHERLERLADIVVVDAKVVDDLRLRATPFGLIVDQQLRVQFKELAWSLDGLVEKWRQKASDDAASPVLDVMAVGGGER